MMTANDDKCTVCGRSPDDHQGVRHPFSVKGSSTSWLKPQKERMSEPVNVTAPRMPSLPQSVMPFDPVLRQALIAKGVITPDDLDAAEKIIRSLGLGGALGGSAESQEPPQR